MNCPMCSSEQSIVLETRDTEDYRRRRRHCKKCEHRWTTHEVNAAYHETLLQIQEHYRQLHQRLSL